jgi:hypothetical protein
LTSGDKLDAESEVKLLSARLRCLKKRHLDIGKIPIDDSKFEELPRGVPTRPPLDNESPEDLRSFGVAHLECPAECAWAEPCREADGRYVGDVLLGR